MDKHKKARDALPGVEVAKPRVPPLSSVLKLDVELFCACKELIWYINVLLKVASTKGFQEVQRRGHTIFGANGGEDGNLS